MTTVAAAPADRSLVHPSRYRGDIDGLRAVAVVSVILFHLSPRHFKAGGIGVDVFFVISGYLIGGIILASLAAGRFSFADFYLRRVRRIAPAFLLTIIAASIAALVLLYPVELMRYAASALAALGCGSNVYFFANTNYFAADSATLPLLHTWTLGVEEQFYFAFPLVGLLLFRALPVRLHTMALVALTAVSLGISQYQMRHAPDAGFYLLPGRAWELLLGTLATRVRHPLLRSARAANLLALAGLALIAGSLLLLDPAKGFPGILAVPPCLGCALVLVSGKARAALAHRLLALPPLRVTGLASYSLYLWHWPIIVFYQHAEVLGRLSPREALATLALIVPAGLLSWQFVETPFRARTMPPRRLLAWCGALLASSVALQAAILLGGGFPQRIPPRALAIARYETVSKTPFVQPQARCFLYPTQALADFDARRCLDVKPGARNWLLVGDSHAAMLYGGLRAAYPAINLMSAVDYGCDVRVDAVADGRLCDDLMYLVFARFLPTARIDRVLLTSRWEVIDPPALARLAATLRRRGTRLVLIGPTPEYSVPVARVMAESVRRGDPSLATRVLEPRLWAVDGLLRALAARIGAAYLSPMRAMCPGGACIVADARGLPLYSDEHHYNRAGSRVAVARLARADPAALAAP